MDDFIIALQAKLDEAKSKENIDPDIEKIQEQINKLKLQAVLDENSAKNIMEQLSRVLNQKITISNIGFSQSNLFKTGQQAGKIISDEVNNALGKITSKEIGLSFTVEKTDSDEFNRAVDNEIKKLQQTKNQLQSVKYTTNTELTETEDFFGNKIIQNVEKLTGAVFKYNTETGEAITKTMKWAQIGTTVDKKGNDIPLMGWVQGLTTYSKSLDEAAVKTDTFVEKQKKAVTDLSNKLNKYYKEGIDQGSSKPIKDESHLLELKQRYDEIVSAIGRVGAASKTSFGDEQNSVNTLISNLQILIKEYKNAETVATSLRSKDISTVKNQYSSKLDNLITKMKSSGLYTNGFKKGSENLSNILNNATDASGLTAFLNGLDKLDAGYKRAKVSAEAFNQSQKVGIKVSGLQSKIDDLHRISPEIEKFRTEINGAEVSVQSLCDDLSKVSTQSDLSVVNEKWRAFRDAAKAAGIAVTEVGTNVSCLTKESSQLLKELESLYQNIKNSQIKKSTLDPIVDSNKIANLNEEIAKAKNRYSSAFRSASKNDNFDISAWNKVKTAIDSATKSRIEYNNAGKTDYLNGQKDNLSGTLSNLKSLLQESSLYTDELKQKITALESELISISNKGDLSTFKTNLKSVESEVGPLLQANKIMFSLNNGTYESKVDSLIAKTRQWTDENGNARISTNELSKAFDQLTTASNNYINSPTEAHQKSLITTEKELNSQIKIVTNSIRSMNAELAKDSAISSLHNQLADFMSKNGKTVKYFGTELKDIFNKTAQGAELTKKELTILKQKFVDIQGVARQTGKLGKTFFQTIKDGMSSFSYWTSSTFLVMKTIQSIKNAVHTVTELDTALVDLKKTAKMTVDELNDFYNSANDTAKQMGVTTEEIIKQAAAWSRLGFSTSEAATKMAKYSSMFATISPGMDLDSATDGLISVMKAFKIGLEDTDDVVDGIMSKINIIGNTQAVNNSDIVEFLTRSSSAMAEANNTLEDTIALGTAMVEITRDASGAGQVLKTVSMRIRGYDEDAEEYIGNVEELSGKIADLTKTASTPGGISLFSDKAKTEYKSTRQILQEISEIYDQLTDKNQADLLEALAGKRNGQAVASVLNNFDTVIASLESMANSAGNAEAEMSVAMDSIDYKLNTLKETGTGISQNLFGREDIKTILDLITSLGNGLDWLTDKLGLLGTIGLGTGIFAGLKNVGRDKMYSLIFICFENADYNMRSLGYQSFHIVECEIHKVNK